MTGIVEKNRLENKRACVPSSGDNHAAPPFAQTDFLDMELAW